MLALLLIFGLIWLFFKLGLGLLHLFVTLILIGLVFAFISYLLIPLLVLLVIAGLGWYLIHL
ncbi:MAG: hypothetical protein ACTIAG_04000 [Lactobacillus sp.]|nr:hypothetical protein [Lactobacillus sp.]MDN6053178.1 hypothetical protein [Lactobacillus sp.]